MCDEPAIRATQVRPRKRGAALLCADSRAREAACRISVLHRHASVGVLLRQVRCRIRGHRKSPPATVPMLAPRGRATPAPLTVITCSVALLPGAQTSSDGLACAFSREAKAGVRASDRGPGPVAAGAAAGVRVAARTAGHGGASAATAAAVGIGTRGLRAGRFAIRANAGGIRVCGRAIGAAGIGSCAAAAVAAAARAAAVPAAARTTTVPAAARAAAGITARAGVARVIRSLSVSGGGVRRCAARVVLHWLTRRGRRRDW